jgi:D-alanyl-lipoteichoic acid acyltransferase DltB (MBOAT superfamily)
LSTTAALVATERIASGLFKKYVLAQGLQRLFLTGLHAHGAYLFWEMQLTYIWLCLDFSAYSDIAVGIGRLIGVATPENFNRPYLARNVIDFWERWHITLSLFIRRHVFVPIQLVLMRRTHGRAPLGIACFAFLVSFLLCGVWHGVGWVWAAWGLYQAIGLIICNLYRHVLIKRIGHKGLNRYLANPWIRVAAISLTFEFTAVGFALVTYPFQELSGWTRSR